MAPLTNSRNDEEKSNETPPIPPNSGKFDMIKRRALYHALTRRNSIAAEVFDDNLRLRILQTPIAHWTMSPETFDALKVSVEQLSTHPANVWTLLEHRLVYNVQEESILALSDTQCMRTIQKRITPARKTISKTKRPPRPA